MKMILTGALAMAVSAIPAAATVTVVSTPGGPTYTGPTPTYDFDTKIPVYTGGQILNTTSTLNAAPLGSTGNYFSVSPDNGPATISLASFGGISSLSFLWGSADYGNTVQFFNAAGVQIGQTYSGNSLFGAAATGSRTSPTTNAVVTSTSLASIRWSARWS